MLISKNRNEGRARGGGGGMIREGSLCADCYQLGTRENTVLNPVISEVFESLSCTCL